MQNQKSKIYIVSNSPHGGAGEIGNLYHGVAIRHGFRDAKFVHNNTTNLRRHWYKAPIQTLAATIDNYVISKSRATFFSLLRGFISSSKKSELASISGNHILIHAHWTPGILGLFFFLRNIKNRKLLLSLHDMFFFTGGCHINQGCQQYESGCKKCPDVHLPFRFLVRLGYNLKKRIYAQNQIIILPPSRQMYEKASKSMLLGSKKIIFMPNPTIMPIIARTKISNFDRELLFVASNLNDKNKNLGLLLKALNKFTQKYNKHFILNLVGYGKIKNYSFELRNHGFIRDKKYLSKLFSQSMFTVICSDFENFPNVISESFSVGTPVLCKKAIWSQSLITENSNGFLYNSEEDLIKYLLKIYSLDSDEYTNLRKNTLDTYRKFKKFSSQKYVNLLK